METNTAEKAMKHCKIIVNRCGKFFILGWRIDDPVVLRRALRHSLPTRTISFQSFPGDVVEVTIS